MTALSSKALEFATTQIGAEEIPRGSNWGKPVQDYLKSVGIDFPASWCMAFVYWCYSQAAKTGDGVNPLFKTGGVLTMWNKMHNEKKLSFGAQPGDIFIIDFGKGLGHTGFVESVAEDGTLHTIEGNTNDTGSREGYEVCRRTRDPKKIKGYIRV